jgi:hypothetical protein
VTRTGELYEFVFRGFLTEEALDRAGRQHPNVAGSLDEVAATRLGIDSLDEAFIAQARPMAVVYMAVCAFENSVRKFISTVLEDKVGADWWDKSAAQGLRKKVEGRQKDEERIRWHSPRGSAAITYTDMGDLSNLIRNNWQFFDPPVPSIEWASSILDIVERSRNVIMHGGVLDREDIERVGINIRAWVKQVGA